MHDGCLAGDFTSLRMGGGAFSGENNCFVQDFDGLSWKLMVCWSPGVQCKCP